MPSHLTSTLKNISKPLEVSRLLDGIVDTKTNRRFNSDKYNGKDRKQKSRTFLRFDQIITADASCSERVEYSTVSKNRNR